jgi:hypothetical protein
MYGRIISFFKRIYSSLRVVIPKPDMPVISSSTSVMNLSVLLHFILHRQVPRILNNQNVDKRLLCVDQLALAWEITLLNH